MRKLHIQFSPLSGEILCGNVLKDKRTWATNKTNVTLEALVAVAEYGVRDNDPIEIKKNGLLKYRIKVEEI